MSKYFNKIDEDFNDTEEYNDYLEHYEDILFELVDIKNDNQIKERLVHLKQTDLILNPKPNRLDETIDDTPKRVKSEEKKASDFIFTEPPKLFCFSQEVIIPDNIMNEYLPSGLSKKIILDFIAFSTISKI